jgi:hypothetical protein
MTSVEIQICDVCYKESRFVLPCDFCEKKICNSDAHFISTHQRTVKGTTLSTVRICLSCKPKV